MAKKSSDFDFVMAAAAAHSLAQPKRSWFSKLPSDAQKRLAAIKTDYMDGKFADLSQTALCVAITSLLRENSWPAPATGDTILRWLRSTGT
jgi:hypothetical protein